MSQKGRVVTLVLEICQDEYPAWVMDSHLNNKVINGFKVRKLAEGDLFTLVGELEDELDGISNK